MCVDSVQTLCSPSPCGSLVVNGDSVCFSTKVRALHIYFLCSMVTHARAHARTEHTRTQNTHAHRARTQNTHAHRTRTQNTHTEHAHRTRTHNTHTQHAHTTRTHNTHTHRTHSENAHTTHTQNTHTQHTHTAHTMSFITMCTHTLFVQPLSNQDRSSSKVSDFVTLFLTFLFLMCHVL